MLSQLLPARNPRKKANPFPSNPETWYDLEYDKNLIKQSVAKQYGIIPSEQEELHYSDWLLLVSGIMEDTPLGQVVMIRKEDDQERLKNFTQHEHHIRNEWRNFRAKQKSERGLQPEDVGKMFEKMFSGMFNN